MGESNELGRQGEELATAYLKKAGYAILETNWRSHHLEIDIIARDGDILVIVEVKSRKSNEFAEPEYSVTRQKQKALIRAANAYIQRKNIRMDARFDIISIILREEGPKITHIPDAFYPLLR